MTMTLCLTGSDGPVAADEAPRVTGLFSDMRRIADAGDLVGMEVFIVYSTDGIRGRHWAFVQIAEGVPAQPFLVEVSVVGDQIQFVTAAGDPRRLGQRRRGRDRSCPPHVRERRSDGGRPPVARGRVDLPRRGHGGRGQRRRSHAGASLGRALRHRRIAPELYH